jgi:hypothetical protein
LESCETKIKKIREDVENKKKKSRKAFLVFSVVLLVSLILSIVVKDIIMPYDSYKAGMAYYDSGKYSEAVDAFDNSGWFYKGLIMDEALKSAADDAITKKDYTQANSYISRLKNHSDKVLYSKKVLKAAVAEREYDIVCYVYLMYYNDLTFERSEYSLPETDYESFYSYLVSTYSFAGCDVNIAQSLVEKQVKLFELMPNNQMIDVDLTIDFKEILDLYSNYSSMDLFMSDNLNSLKQLWDCQQIREWFLSDYIITDFMVGRWSNGDVYAAKYFTLRYNEDGSGGVLFRAGSLGVPNVEHTYYDIQDQTLVYLDENSEWVCDVFSFVFIDADTIECFCYYDGNTITLER